MSPGTSFGPHECVAAFGAAADMFEVHSAGLDEINVFPVADSDTGRNMAATMSAISAAVATATRFVDVSDAVRAAVPEAAHGCAGRMLGQYVTGFVSALVNTERADAAMVGFAFEDAAAAARGAVADPRAGTMVTVADVAAAAAMSAVDRGADVASLANEVADAAVEALERTPEQLPELAEHGVVDAGAAGLCVVLEAIAAVVNGEEFDESPAAAALDPAAPVIWEIAFALDSDDADADRLRVLLETLGTAAQVDGGPPRWDCVVHATNIGAVIEAALSVGRPRAIRVDPSPRGR